MTDGRKGLGREGVKLLTDVPYVSYHLGYKKKLDRRYLENIFDKNLN